MPNYGMGSPVLPHVVPYLLVVLQVYLALADAVVREAYRAGEVTTDAPQVTLWR